MVFLPVTDGTLTVQGMPVTLVPWPVTVEVAAGCTVHLFDGTVVETRDGDDPDGFLARELAAELEAATGGYWHCARDPWQGAVRLDHDAACAPGAYRVTIADGSCVIAAADTAGLRSGVQTVRQLLRQCGGVLPVVRIEDAPAYATRGYYLDVARGRVPTLDWLKQWADALELAKYNQLQLYIEHSFAFQGFSEVWRGKGPLQPEELMEFDAYCRRRGIELVPSVSLFSHLYTVLRTRGFRELGEFPEDADRPFSFIERQEHHTLNIALDEAFALSRTIIDQYLPLFTSDKFNICSDETFDLGRGRSRGTAEQYGVATMYARYVNRLCAYVRERGRTPMLWGDIVLQHPDMLNQLDHDAILLNWNYAPDVTDAGVRALADAGMRQMVCPAVHGWNTMLPKLPTAWRNISRLARYGQACGAEGILVTDWGDYGHVNDPRLSVPGMLYGAECAWRRRSGEGDSSGSVGSGADDAAVPAKLNARISMVLFHEPGGQLLDTWASLSEQARFSWFDAVQFVELDAGDGTVNTDVQAFIATAGTPEERTVGDTTELAEARRRFLSSAALRLKEVPGSARWLDCIQHSLAASRLHVAEHSITRVLLRYADGQDLLDQCGWWLAVRAGVLDGAPGRADDMPEPAAVAAGLEEWFERYRDLWLEVSDASEVARIGAVIWRLADLLR